MVKQVMFIAACVAAFSLQACSNAADQAKVEADVQKAQAAGEKKIVDAQARLEQVNAENNKNIVDARADARVDAVQAKANDAATADASATPAAPPAADESVTKARVAAMSKVADAQYNVDKAKADAAYGVTMARCNGQSSTDMQTVCRDGAQKTLESAVATAKARNDAAHRRAATVHKTRDGQNG